MQRRSIDSASENLFSPDGSQYRFVLAEQNDIAWKDEQLSYPDTCPQT